MRLVPDKLQTQAVGMATRWFYRDTNLWRKTDSWGWRKKCNKELSMTVQIKVPQTKWFFVVCWEFTYCNVVEEVKGMSSSAGEGADPVSVSLQCPSLPLASSIFIDTDHLTLSILKVHSSLQTIPVWTGYMTSVTTAWHQTSCVHTFKSYFWCTLPFKS